jgi:hypothetical protein
MNIDLICDLCGKSFSKPKKEYTRRKKRGQEKFYCSRKCGGMQEGAIKNISKNWGKNNHFLKRGGYFGDELTPFRPHMRRVRRRDKKYDLTLEDLKMQWEVQDGRCVYTKVPLILTDPYETAGKNPIYLASLDRIDSTFGYVKGNIQWVSVTMNYAKNNMTHEQTLEFCEVIRSPQLID